MVFFEVFPPRGDALPDDGSIVGTWQAGEAGEHPGNHVAEELPEELAQSVLARLGCHYTPWLVTRGTEEE